jgi:hypothetical protein
MEELLLKPHEAVDDGGGNGVQETAATKPWAWARR